MATSSPDKLLHFLSRKTKTGREGCEKQQIAKEREALKMEVGSENVHIAIALSCLPLNVHCGNKPARRRRRKKITR